LKKLVFLMVLFFAKTNLLFSQNLSFIYKVTSLAGDQQKSSKTENYFLDISGPESVFRSEHDRYYDSVREKTGKGLGTPLDFDQLYSRKDKSKIYKTVTVPLVMDTYDISIEEKLNWKLLNDTATVAGVKCQKATVVYGGRIWEAWFGKSIALQEGPYIFHGLPGLIIRIADTDSNFIFSLISYTEKKGSVFFPPKKGKVLTFPVFKTLEENFYRQPFAELERSGLKLMVTDENNNKMSWDSREMSQKMQKTLKEHNNPPEIDYRPDFK